MEMKIKYGIKSVKFGEKKNHKIGLDTNSVIWIERP